MFTKKSLLVLGALGALLGSLPAAAACNEKCLNRALDGYLAQLVKHDPAPLKVSANLIAVENAKPVALGQGSWQSVASLPIGMRFADASTSQIVYFGAVKDKDGKTGSLFLRLKVADGRIAESELFTRGAYTGEGQETPGMLEPDILYDAIVPEARRSTRDQLKGVVNAYMEGISKHDGALFPASYRCDRYQAGRKWTNAPDNPPERGGGTCQGSMANLKGQEVVNRRFPVMIPELGIAVGLFIIPHAERDPKGATNVAEVFKIVDGKVRSIEEFSFVAGFPPSSGFADE
ncbi:MAG: hypothetical protein QM718_15540 [Steroidobacteraceae bacterium]